MAVWLFHSICFLIVFHFCTTADQGVTCVYGTVILALSVVIAQLKSRISKFVDLVKRDVASEARKTIPQWFCLVTVFMWWFSNDEMPPCTTDVLMSGRTNS